MFRFAAVRASGPVEVVAAGLKLQRIVEVAAFTPTGLDQTPIGV